MIAGSMMQERLNKDQYVCVEIPEPGTNDVQDKALDARQKVMRKRVMTEDEQEQEQSLLSRNASKATTIMDLEENDESEWDHEEFPEPSTDPFACVCCCQFRKLGHSYILSERRSFKNGQVKKSLVIVGPHWIGVLVTLSIILVASFFFIKDQCLPLPWYYTAIAISFCWLTLHYLFHTACKDPGIVLVPKRKRYPVDPVDGVTDTEVDEGKSNDRISSVPKSRMRSTMLYCDICAMDQAPTTEHCDDCGVCIEEYDHHCPWMGKCIGKKNMSAFKKFNVTWICYVVFVIWTSMQHMPWNDWTVQTLHRAANGQWMPSPAMNASTNGNETLVKTIITTTTTTIRPINTTTS